MANQGNQQITWKYRTPLRGQYLGTMLSHTASTGLCSLPEINISGTTLTIGEFSMIVRPSDLASTAQASTASWTGASDVLMRVTTTQPYSSTQVDALSKYSAIGFSYSFSNSGQQLSDWYGTFTVLKSENISSYLNTPGAIIIANIYTENGETHATSVGADWSSMLVEEKGFDKLSWLAPIRLTRNSNTVSTTVVEIRGRSNERQASPMLYTTASVGTKAGVPTNQLNLSEASSGNYLAIGYPQGSDVLSVLSTSSTLDGLQLSFGSQVATIILWSGNTYTSTYYRTFPSNGNPEITDNSQIANGCDYISSSGAGSVFVPKSCCGVANGVATLDSSGRIPASQLTLTALEFQGNWDPTTGVAPSKGAGVIITLGDFWIVSGAAATGTAWNDITWYNGDWIIYNGSAWIRSTNSNLVQSVNGYTGTVQLNPSASQSGCTLTIGLSGAGSASVNITCATNATNATNATCATNATKAECAHFAVCDSLGNVISSTYLTSASLSGYALAYNGSQNCVQCAQYAISAWTAQTAHSASSAASATNATNSACLGGQTSAYYASAASIPTNNNQLTNGCGYLTSADLSNYVVCNAISYHIGRGSSANATNGLAIGECASAAGVYSNAIGYRASTAGNSSNAIGIYASAAGDCSNAIGKNASATGVYSNAIGCCASAAGVYSNAIGYRASTGDFSNAIGCCASAAGDCSNAIGCCASAAGDCSNAIGYRASTGTCNTYVYVGTQIKDTYGCLTHLYATCDALECDVFNALISIAGWYVGKGHCYDVGIMGTVHDARLASNPYDASNYIQLDDTTADIRSSDRNGSSYFNLHCDCAVKTDHEFNLWMVTGSN